MRAGATSVTAMAKIVKYAVLGAGVGAGYAAVQAYRRDEPIDVLANQAGRVAAEGAAVGVVAALLLGRRKKRKAGKSSTKLAKGAAKKAWKRPSWPGRASSTWWTWPVPMPSGPPKRPGSGRPIWPSRPVPMRNGRPARRGSEPSGPST